MIPSVSATEACRLLNLSPKTLRRRLAADYDGPEKISGAEKESNEWLIPSAEISRILEERQATVNAAGVVGLSMRLIAATLDAAVSEEMLKVHGAAHEFVLAPTDKNLEDLRSAIKSIEEWHHSRRLLTRVAQTSADLYEKAADAANDPDESGELVAGSVSEYVKRISSGAPTSEG